MQQRVRDNFERAVLFFPLAMATAGIASVIRLYAINDWTWTGVNTLLPYALFAGMLMGIFPILAGLGVAVWMYSAGKPVMGPAVLGTVAVWVAQHMLLLLASGASPALPDSIYLLMHILNTVMFTEMIEPHQSRLHLGDHLPLSKGRS